jgi:predicted metal-binding membrane protein
VLGRSGTLGQFRRVLRRHPELTPLALAAASWVAVLWLHLARHPPVSAHSPHHDHGSQQTSGVPHSGSAGGLIADSSTMSIGMWLGMWTLMCVAMMVPTIIPAIRHVAANSLRRRAGRSVAVLVGTYLSGWFVFGLAALTWLTVMRWLGVPSVVMLLSVVVIGMTWLVLPVQKHFRWVCHRTVPLPPTGWRAVRGCVHFGARQALGCIGICWPLMLVMALQLNRSILWMTTLAALVIVWKYLPRRYRPTLNTWALRQVNWAGWRRPPTPAHWPPAPRW